MDGVRQGRDPIDCISAQSIRELSKRYGDAFYLLLSDRFRQNYIELKQAFSDFYPNFNIAYSYKTNYIPQLCQIVDGFGGYAEVVSDMEMELALRCGVLPSHIIWNGPVKRSDKVEQLLTAGGMVNLDSIREADIIHDIAVRNPESILNVGLRCNFDIGDGVVSRFGFDTEGQDFQKALDFVRGEDKVHLVNLQCHFAKRTIDYWPARARGMLELFKRVSDALGYSPKRLDLGGGIYGKMLVALEEQFSSEIPKYKDYARAVMPILRDYFQDKKTEILLEPGSALAGDCMKFAGKVESIKTVRKKTFITILGSRKNINMGSVNPPIEIVSMGGEQIKCRNADIVGYTCIESDVLYCGYTGDIAPGDFVVIENCGSYSIVMKPPFIMGNFPIIDVGGESEKVIKRQESFDDLFHTFCF